MEEEKDIAFEAIKAMFETGKIKKMRQLEKLSPTKLAKALGINYGRYINKLYNPEFFVIMELQKFAEIIDTKLKIISDIVIAEIEKK